MTTLSQGALDLLDHDVARRLLTSAEPARPACVARDGTPRALPTMFPWTGVLDFRTRFPGAMPVRS